MTTIRIDLNVDSGGTITREAREAALLAAQLERVERIAESVRRKLIRSGQNPPGGGGPGGGGGGGYRQFRGETGTGAAGRDFAKEASGLGGLVRVYATFAANVFAAGAAFAALSKAVDTSNMVKGLDQLGAASGRNLSGLAKQLTIVSDGAISLKDAMAATAKATAAGLSGDALLRMTEVAKKASQALGRSMPDALGRMSDGIAKIEPELLDELGIMVKVDAANTNYARSLGKTANSLTDLEKRQAFANEAISQGEKKFKDIEIASNPYSKILASAENLTHAGLELVNKVLGPVINLLSTSPTALSLAIAGIASMLLKQAIPALGQWRAGMAAAAIASRDAASQISKDFRAFQLENVNANANIIGQRVAQQKAAMEASMATLRQAATAGIRDINGNIARIMNQPIQDITQQNLARIQLQQKAYENRATKLMREAVDPARSLQSQQAKSTEASDYTRSANALREFRAQVPLAQADAAAFHAAQIKAGEDLAKAQGKWSEYAQRQRVAERADRAAARAEILGNVAANTQVMGYRGAFAALRQDIKTGTAAVGVEGQAGYIAARAPLTGLNALGTTIRGTFAIATSAVTGFLSAFGPWMAVIGIAIAGVSFLIEKLSSNNKELKEFSGASEILTSNIEMVGKTLDSINKKPFLDQFSVETMAAKTSAIVELAGALDKMVTALSIADATASGFDKFLDGFKSFVGVGLRAKATTGVVGSLVAALKTAEGPAKDQLEKTLEGILDTTDLTVQGISKSINSLELEEVTTKFTGLGQAITTSTLAMKEQSGVFVTLKSGLSEVSKAAASIVVGLLPTDNFSKFATAVINASGTMTNALGDPISELLVMKTILEDVGSLSILPPTSATNLIGMKKEIQAQSIALKEAEANVRIYNEELAKSAKARGDSKPIKYNDSRDQIVKQSEQTEAGLKMGLALSQGQVKLVNDQIKTTTNNFGSVVKDALAFGASLLESSIKNAREAGGLTVAKAAAAGLTGPGTADVMYQLKARELKLQEDQLNVEMTLVNSQTQNKNALERLSSIVEIDTQTRLKQAAETKLLSAKETEKPGILTSIAQYAKKITSAESAVEMGQVIAAKIAEVTKFSSPKQAYTALTGQIAKEGQEGGDPKILQALQAQQAQVAGGYARQIAIEAEKQAAAVTRQLEVLREQSTEAQKVYDVKIATTDLDLKSVTTAQDILGIYSVSLQSEKLRLATAKETLELAKENAIQEGIISVLKARGSIASVQLKQAETDKTNKLAAIVAKQDQDKVARDNDTRTRLAANEIRMQGFRDAAFTSEQSIAKDKLDISNSLLAKQQSLGTISEQYAIKETARIAENNLLLEKASAIRAAELENRRAIADIELRRTNTIKTFSTDTSPKVKADVESATTTELGLQAAKYQGITDAINSGNEAKLVSIKYTKEANLELDKQATVLKLLENATVSLSKAFGNVGTSIATIAKTLQKSATDQVKLEAKKNKDIDSIRESSMSSPKKTQEIEKIKQKFTQETTSAQLSAAADVAGAVADSFGEQSRAAEQFHKVEKLFHIAKLVMDIQSIASSAIVFAQESLFAEGTALAWIPAVWAKAFGQGGPYLGWALGAAAVAMIGLGASGGGGPTGPSQADIGKLEGTGQKYDANGKIVSTGTGVLGDDTARSESIAKSIELVAKYTFDEIEYSSQMLKSLQNIEVSLTGVSKSLVLTAGLTGGSAFGTLEGSIAGSLGKSTFFDSFSQKLTNSIFGGNESTSITGSGITLKGLLGDIAGKKVTGEQYETGTKTTSGGIFRSDSTEAFKNVAALSNEFNDALALSFSSVSKGLVSVGETLGLDAKTLTDTLNAIPINLAIETRDLKGKELQDKVAAVLSATMDSIAESALKIVKPLQKMNEGLLETAVRVANDSRVIDLQLKTIGKSFGAVGSTSLVAREALLDLSGGIDKFTSDANYFRDTFLSEAQKLEPTTKAVGEEMDRLHLSTKFMGTAAIDSREKFAKLVLAQDLSTVSGQELYTSLMAVQKGFAAVYAASDEVTLNMKDLADAKLTQLSKVMELLGDKLGVQAAARKKEMAAMDSRLRPMQEWIYALEDEADARDALKTAYSTEADARQASIDKLKASRDTLKDFSKSLALGAQSPLTPGQKYEEAKSNLADITKVLDNVATTTADRDIALGKLPGAISSLLETSKVFNASSDAYQQDYTYSQKLLKDNSDKLSVQITAEEKSLQLLTEQVTALGVLNDTVTSLADYIKKFMESTVKANEVGAKTEGANAQFISSIYNSNPGLRKDDTEGKKFWVDILDAGKAGHSEVLKAINDEVMIRSWFTKVLHRGIDQDEKNRWLGEIRTSDDIKATKEKFAQEASKELGVPRASIGAFAKGGVMGAGLNLVGEEGAEFVNFSNTGQVSTSGQTSNMMQNFTNAITGELAKLRREVSQLREEAAKQAEMLAQTNWNSNQVAATKVVEAVADGANQTHWNTGRNTGNIS